MYDEKEFPRFFLDTRAAEAAMFTKVKERVEDCFEQRQNGVKTLRKIEEILFDTHATLPADAEARISASDRGYVSIVIENLDSFHDVSEVVGVLFRELKRYPSMTEPYVYDMPDSRSKDYTIGWDVSLRATLGRNANCKVVTVGRSAVPMQQSEPIRKILCPGDAEYDDYI